MPLSTIINNRIQRLIPHEGLVVNVDTWEAAHGYHVLQQRLHSMAMHNAGVVTGLDVVAWDPPDNSVVINPGVAIDADGNMIVVAEPQRFQLQAHEPGTLFIILQYREVPDRAGSEGNNSAPRYIIEAYRLEERRDLPEESYLELARIRVSGGAVVQDAQHFANPEADEIDLRSRLISGPRPLATIGVGVVPLEMDPRGEVVNARGTVNLVRAINNTTKYHAEFRGAINLSQEISNCELIVIAGVQEVTLADEWVVVLRNFIERGGVILAEGSRRSVSNASEYPPFRNSFLQLSELLNRELTTVEMGSPILESHYFFATPPDGVDGHALLVAGDGIVYTDNDYGSLWEGGRTSRPASREAIRAATEFGVNVAVFAANRVRNHAARLAAR